jgi:hypothetical protein
LVYGNVKISDDIAPNFRMLDGQSIGKNVGGENHGLIEGFSGDFLWSY